MTHATGAGTARRAFLRTRERPVSKSHREAGDPTTTMAGSRRGAAAAVPAFYRLLITLLTLFAFPRSADGGVHAVLPSSGAAGGSDTAVTVLGAEFFQTPKTSCRFGGDVVAADVTDESTVVCYPPASVDGAGFVYVEVSMNALDFTSSGVLGKCVEPAQLASMRPLGRRRRGW